MAHLLNKDRLKDLLKTANMTQDVFIEKCENAHFSESIIRKYLSGERNIPHNNVKLILDILEKNISSVPTMERSQNALIKEKIEFEAQCEAEQMINDIYTDVKKRYMSPLEIYTFCANQDFYATISIEVTDFLIKTTDLSVASRQELLAFMEQMEIKAKTVRETSETILKFLDMRDNGTERIEKNYSTQCKRSSQQEVDDIYWGKMYKILQNHPIPYYDFLAQILAFTTMDKLDWDLLIAYAVVTHEDAGRAEKINEKLESMLED